MLNRLREAQERKLQKKPPKKPKIYDSSKDLAKTKAKCQIKTEAKSQSKNEGNLEKKKKRKISETQSSFVKSKKRATKKSDYDETSSDDVSFKSNGSESPWEDFNKDDEYLISLIQVSPSQFKNGDFVLMQFQGDKRNTKMYKYVCAIENIADNGDIEVASFKSIDNSSQNFAVNSSDVSYVSQKQILGVLPFPTIMRKGERFYYHFPKKVVTVVS